MYNTMLSRSSFEADWGSSTPAWPKIVTVQAKYWWWRVCFSPLHRKHIKKQSGRPFSSQSQAQECYLLWKQIKPTSFVRIFQLYLKHRPADCDDVFYLTPLKRPKGDMWYSIMSIGHNTLPKTVARLCRDAGISGFKTNHSLRVTTATRLFHSGAD